MRRIIGLVILFVGLGGIALSGVGLVFGRQAVDAIGENLDHSFQLTAESLDNLINTLILVKTTSGEIVITLETAQGTADDVATAVQETRPLLNQINTLTTEEIPQSLEEVQTAIPNIAQVAGVVDSTLTTLNNFRIDEEIFGLQFQYDLGINYDPSEPFDQTVNDLGASLEGLPEQLRALETYLTITSSNLNTISQDLHALADNMETVNGRITDITPLLDEYLRLITNAKTQLTQLRTDIRNQINTLKLGLSIIMLWLGISQLVPLYLGWELLRGQSALKNG